MEQLKPEASATEADTPLELSQEELDKVGGGRIGSGGSGATAYDN